MPKRLEESEINRHKQELIEYLIRHPKATYEEAEKTGFCSGLRAFGCINNARKAAGVESRFVRLSKAKRKQRLLEYLREHPETTTYDIKHRLKGALYTDFMKAYVQEGHGMNKARKDAGVSRFYSKFREEKRRQKIKESKQRVLAYLRENTDAITSDLVEAGLGNDLRIVYGNKINHARRELGLRPLTQSEWLLHKNTLYSDLWKNNFKIPPNQYIERDVATVLRSMLGERELDIVIRYYGVGQEKQALEKIREKHRLSRERVGQIIKHKILPKLSYLNNQKAIANACLSYATDKKTRRFLAEIPEYSTGNFLPYRLDQLYFPGIRNPTIALREAGIVTIGQFLKADTEGREIWGFKKKKRAYIMQELRKFGVESSYK